MKSMLYVGAALMIGASIYGFVDYKQTHHKKEFKNMYDHPEKKTAEVTDEKKAVDEKTDVVSNVTTSKPEVNKKSKVKKALGKQAVAVNDVEPVIDPISDDARISGNNSKNISNSSVEVKTSSEPTIKKVKKKKKLNTKIFSRAPLREEEELEPVIRKTN